MLDVASFCRMPAISASRLASMASSCAFSRSSTPCLCSRPSLTACFRFLRAGQPCFRQSPARSLRLFQSPNRHPDRLKFDHHSELLCQNLMHCPSLPPCIVNTLVWKQCRHAQRCWSLGGSGVSKLDQEKAVFADLT